MGVSIERTGFISCKDLTEQLITDMRDNGFTMVFPAIVTPGTHKAVLEASSTVDPLNQGANPQPWRVFIEAQTDFRVVMNVATPLQIKDDSTVSTLTQADGGGTSGIIGMDDMGSQPSPQNCFIERTDGGATGITTLEQAQSYPMSYRLTITDRGFCVFVWTQASDIQGNKFSWVLVQRPVDHLTGATLVAGKAPVFCVYSAGNNIRKFVVREADIQKPTKSLTAVSNTEDSNAIINDQKMVSINEASKYVVRFPNGLNTQRYAYTEELDMLGYTSADVVSEWSQVPIRPYGETQDRIYKALKANGANNIGMRIAMLMTGAGAGN